MAADATPDLGTVPMLSEWEYVTTARLVADTARLAMHLPADVDAVVGVARSGLLPASLVAALLHLPEYAVSRWAGVVDVGHGSRLAAGDPAHLTGPRPPAEPTHVLVIDDTAARGRQMPHARRLVRERFPGARVTTAVVYAHPLGRRAVDRCAAVLPGDHYLEWNWINSPHLRAVAVGLGGVLCEPCRPGDDDDGPRYAQHVRDARRLHAPQNFAVPVIVTGRHERYRPETEGWLRRHGAKWERLVMRDFPRPPADRFAAEVARFKAAAARRHGVRLFAESCPVQAEAIAREAGVPVICPAAEKVFPPGGPKP